MSRAGDKLLDRTVVKDRLVLKEELLGIVWGLHEEEGPSPYRPGLIPPAAPWAEDSDG